MSNNRDSQRITGEISNMLHRGIIESIHDTKDLFLSNIFTRNKSDGKPRVILDLSMLNQFVTYKHFKMETIQNAIDLMSPSCYMASIDWKDAYYSVPIAHHFRKFLSFQWEDKLFQFTCLPNGLASAPRYFTRLSKVLFSVLRNEGLMSTSYIDDCLLFANPESEARDNVRKTVELSTQAGFVVHPEKSVLTPTKQITYLGFVLNSETMTIRLTPKRIRKIKERCSRILKNDRISVHKLSQAIGLMVASFPGVRYGKLHYRGCDNEKIRVLRENANDFQACMNLTAKCKRDLRWWVINIETTFNSVVSLLPDFTLETDPSTLG